MTDEEVKIDIEKSPNWCTHKEKCTDQFCLDKKEKCNHDGRKCHLDHLVYPDCRLSNECENYY